MDTGIPYGTMIPTPTGFVGVETLSVGDKVYAIDGNVCEVVKAEETGLQQTYNLTFDDGRVIPCSSDQKIPVRYLDNFKMIIEFPRIKDILDDYKIDCNGENLYRYFVVYGQNVMFNKRPIGLDPTVAGLFIGSIIPDKRYLCIRTKNIDIVEYIAKTLNLRFKYNSTKQAWYFYNKFGFKARASKYLRYIGNPQKLELNERYIPREYLENDPEITINILNGLMTASGINIGDAPDGVKPLFATRSKRLAIQVKFIMDEMGIKHNVIELDTDQGLINIVVFEYHDNAIPEFLILTKISPSGKKYCKRIEISDDSHLILVESFNPVLDSTDIPSLREKNI